MKHKFYIDLADKYEVKSFIENDPIQFCYKYSDKKDIEITGIIAAWISYGMRKVFIPKIEYLLINVMGNEPYNYIMSDSWEQYKDNYSCLYRLNTWHNFAMLCEHLKHVYNNNGDMENAVLEHFLKRNGKFKYYHQALCDLLAGETLIPTAKSLSSNKRMNMFLRWMVRRNSLVDLGLWKTFKKENLLIPCDRHVLCSAKECGLITKVEESLQVAIRLTEYSKKIFDEDPARMDFALYGYGIDKK